MKAKTKKKTVKQKRTYEKPLKLKGKFIDILDAALGKEVKEPIKSKSL